MPRICFQTHKFPAIPEGDLAQPGSAIAHWIRSHLIEAGFPCCNLIQEDYGWGFCLDDDSAIWVAISFSGGVQHDVTNIPEWWISLVDDTFSFNPSQWFKKKQGRGIVNNVFAIIEQKISKDPESEVQRVEADF